MKGGSMYDHGMGTRGHFIINNQEDKAERLAPLMQEGTLAYNTFPSFN